MAEGGLSSRGVYMGRDVYGGGAFVYDPFELYAQGKLSNPNWTVLGDLGSGKSATLKAYIWRQLVFGRRAWIIDPKREYTELAVAAGRAPVLLQRGGHFRLNPLDPDVGDQNRPSQVVRDELLDILIAVTAGALRRDLRSEEEAACEVALTHVITANREPTLGHVVRAMLEPTESGAATVYSTATKLAEEGRQAALALRRLVEGDLRGMFDGPTTAVVDLRAPVVVLDMRDVYQSDALGILMTCAAAWFDRALGVDDGRKTISVIDEGWAILRNLQVARWMQSRWKLARRDGLQNVLIVQRLSDLDAAGSVGSEQVQLAKGLLSDSQTRIIFRQNSNEVPLVTELAQLTDREAALLPRLSRGHALWKVGTRSFRVHVQLTAAELALADTDQRMVAV